MAQTAGERRGLIVICVMTIIVVGFALVRKQFGRDAMITDYPVERVVSSDSSKTIAKKKAEHASRKNKAKRNIASSTHRRNHLDETIPHTNTDKTR